MNYEEKGGEEEEKNRGKKESACMGACATTMSFM